MKYEQEDNLGFFVGLMFATFFLIIVSFGAMELIKRATVSRGPLGYDFRGISPAFGSLQEKK